ncbi:hypothetical protein AMK59_4518, partial [Oryctes borbonicus]
MSEEIKPEVIEKTQKVLGKYISKPVLSEKLLRKPPFRFLHDIVRAIVKDTGFLKGLYTESELISDNVKVKDLKVAFLTKLIEAIKIITHIELKVKPTKVIAGLEPSETNKLLQAIGYALDKKLDSTEYIKKINSKSKTDPAKKLSETAVNKEKRKESVRTKKHESEIRKDEKTSNKGEGSRRDNHPVEKIRKTKDKDKNIKSSPITKKNIEPEKLKPSVNADNTETMHIEDPGQEGDHKPMSDIKDNTIEMNKDIEKESISKDNKSSENVDLMVEENLVKDVAEQDTQKILDRAKSARPQSNHLKKIAATKLDKAEESIPKINNTSGSVPSLRPPSVRPSSARPGAPRLRPDSTLPMQEMVTLGKINVIVENYNTKETDEEETVVIENKELEPEQVQKLLDIPEDKGHLVEQILEQIHDDDVAEHVKNKNDIDYENEGFHNKDIVNR